MRYTPTKPVTLRTSIGPRIFQPGETFEADEAEALPFVQRGILQRLEDAFESRWLIIYHLLTNCFEIWSISPYKDRIKASLSLMDDHWTARDLTAFQTAIKEIEDLVSTAVTEDFQKKNVAVKIRSSVLGEDIYLVSNAKTKARLKSEGLAVYLPDEIPNLRGLSPEDLRIVNRVKKTFKGEII